MELFFFIHEKVKARLARWKECLLLLVGKEVLLKSIVSAILSYAMSSFLLPKSICHIMNKNQCAF